MKLRPASYPAPTARQQRPKHGQPNRASTPEEQQQGEGDGFADCNERLYFGQHGGRGEQGPF